jgi:hypothetical protein
MPELKDSELRVLLVLLRETVGWHRDDALCSLSYFELEHRTGRQREALADAIQSLERQGLIHSRKPLVSGKPAKHVILDARFSPVLTKKQRKRKKQG